MSRTSPSAFRAGTRQIEPRKRRICTNARPRRYASPRWRRSFGDGTRVAVMLSMTAHSLTAEKTTRNRAHRPDDQNRRAIRAAASFAKESVELLWQHGFEGARGYASHADLLHATRRGRSRPRFSSTSSDGTGVAAEIFWRAAREVAQNDGRRDRDAAAVRRSGVRRRWMGRATGADARDVYAIAEPWANRAAVASGCRCRPPSNASSAIWESLTRRQRQVLGLLGCGLGNPKIAGRAGDFGAGRQGSHQRSAGEVRRGQSDGAVL